MGLEQRGSPRYPDYRVRAAGCARIWPEDFEVNMEQAETMTIKCSEVRKLMIPKILNDLGLAGRARLYAHLATCDECLDDCNALSSALEEITHSRRYLDILFAYVSEWRGPRPPARIRVRKHAERPRRIPVRGSVAARLRAAAVAVQWRTIR